mgnify:CR=1 FL=1
MAPVYLALQESVQREVALKVMAPTLVGAAEPESLVIAAGMTIGTLLTLYVVPVMYLLMTKLKYRVHGVKPVLVTEPSLVKEPVMPSARRTPTALVPRTVTEPDCSTLPVTPERISIP